MRHQASQAVTNVADGAEPTSLKAGQHDFQAIYDEFQPKVHRYLARLVGATEAEDLTQEVFVNVSQGLVVGQFEN